MNKNGFVYYLKSNFMYATEPPYTHLLMNGGKLRVPKEKYEEFLLKYSQFCVSNSLYVIELKTYIFNFFLDLDFYQQIGLPYNIILKYITTIQKSLFNILCHTHDNKESRTILCLTQNKEVRKNEETYIKTGIHLYWPEVNVNIEHALIFRNIIIDTLEEQYGERGSHNTWDDVVDKTVLERNGLRMIGSRKLSNCNHCKVQKQKVCTLCNGTGKQDEGRIYEPHCVIDGNGKEMKSETSKIKTSQFKKIKETTIRTFFDEIPKPFAIPEKYKLQPKKIKKRTIKNKEGTLFDIECSNKDCLEKSSKAFKLCVKFIQESFPHPNIIDVIEIFKKGKEKQYYIVRTSSRYCMNINREHRSNHVYYYIDKSFAYQKCLCTCDTTAGRIHGKCMDYQSSGRRIPVDLQKLLFPQKDKALGLLFDIQKYSKENKKQYLNSLQALCNFYEDDISKRRYKEDNQLFN